MALPFIEEIYDLETEELEGTISRIQNFLLNPNKLVPEGFSSWEKFERKGGQLREAIELELQERRQVEDVINFFTDLPSMPAPQVEAPQLPSLK